MFSGKAKPISVEHLLGLTGRLLALSANIRLGWEGVIERNTLAYYEYS
jgi:hypothetical protein